MIPTLVLAECTKSSQRMSEDFFPMFGKTITHTGTGLEFILIYRNSHHIKDGNSWHDPSTLQEVSGFKSLASQSM